MSTATPPPDADTAPPRRSAYSMGSLPNMVRSMLVVLAFVALLVAIVPRVSTVTQPAVDAAAVASNTAKESGLAILVPVGLPAGWKATSARYLPGTDGLTTWQAGYTTPGGQFLAVKQAQGATAAWVETATNRGRPAGTEEAAGRTWQRLSSADGRQTSLLDLATSGLTTVVSGTAGRDELLTFTNALRQAPPG